MVRELQKALQHLFAGRCMPQEPLYAHDARVSLKLSTVGYKSQNALPSIVVDADDGHPVACVAEGVPHSNVSMGRDIKNPTRNIVTYACAASNTAL